MNIVLVEDNPSDTRWFRKLLINLRLRHTVTQFNTGVEALRLLERTVLVPDVIISEWFLPIMDFPQLIGRIRAIRGLERVPVGVFAPTVDFISYARRYGSAVFCLTKPVDEDQLRQLFLLRGSAH